MKVFIFLTSIFFTTLSLTLNAEENEIVLHMCENCSYSEAKYYANQEIPVMRCEAANPNQIMTIENQACFADEKKIIIADTSSNNHFAFLVGYYNQGSPAYYLETYTSDTSLSSNDLIAINKIKLAEKSFSKFILEAQQEIKQQPVSSQTYFNAHSYNDTKSYSNTASSEENCPSYVKSAVDAIWGADTATNLSTKLTAKAYADFGVNPGSFFETDQMDSLGFSIFVAGFSYQGSWKKVAKNFTSKVDLRAPSSAKYNVLFNIRWNKTDEAIDVSINQTRTILEGKSLSSLKNAGSVNISPCLESALDGRLVSNSVPAGGSGGSGGIGGDDSSGGSNGSTPIFGGGGSGDGWENQLCDKHYYDATGKKIATARVSC